MQLRDLPEGLKSEERCDERRKRIEQELKKDLSSLAIDPTKLGVAEEKNCEQMFGHVPVPVGYAGPLKVSFSSGEKREVHLPLATTEGALVASINRGCKALSQSGFVKVRSVYHGITRSMAFKVEGDIQLFIARVQKLEDEWKEVGGATSQHLRILHYDLDIKDDYVFLTIACDTDEAMGMNMVTVAAQAISNFLVETCDAELITVAGNVDSDKKPSMRTKEKGRGYEVFAEAEVSFDIISSVLKSSPESLLEVAKAKLEAGSEIAGAIGKNLHAANVIAALYLATGQDIAHTVEGSLADTSVHLVGAQHAAPLQIKVRLPAILVGIRGGGTILPAQSQCLDLLLKNRTKLHPCAQLAESIGAAVLAGEISLLAAQASHQLAQAHAKLAR